MPRKSKKAAEDDAEPTPVRRSTRARRSVVVNDEPDDFEVEPPKKRARGKRTSTTNVSYEEEDNSNEQSKVSSNKDSKDDEFDPNEDEDEEEKPKTPAKARRGNKQSEHKDTPAPPRSGGRGRGRKRQTPDEVHEEEGEGDVKNAEEASESKKLKGDEAPAARGDTTEKSEQAPESKEEAVKVPEEAQVEKQKEPVEEKKVEETPVEASSEPASAAAKDEVKESKTENADVATEAAPKEAAAAPTTSQETTAKENGLKATEVKEPSGYEKNTNVDAAKDVSVASAVVGGPQETKETLDKLENADVVAVQKSTSAATEAAETCGFKVIGEGETRLLLRAGSGVELKEKPETKSLRVLAFKELEEITSEANRKRIEDYLTTYCSVKDEFTVFSLAANGKPFTLLNIQMESKNVAITALLIGCIMRSLDSRPHAFVVTGHMPHVRPGSPAYELLRDGYFGNHSIETLQRMQDITLDDEEEYNKGLIDFLWRAYQHSRPWMRSVYETVLNAESVVSSTGCAMLWHSTKGIDVVKVLNDASIVEADLAIKI